MNTNNTTVVHEALAPCRNCWEVLDSWLISFPNGTSVLNLFLHDMPFDPTFATPGLLWSPSPPNCCPAAGLLWNQRDKYASDKFFISNTPNCAIFIYLIIFISAIIWDTQKVLGFCTVEWNSSLNLHLTNQMAAAASKSHQTFREFFAFCLWHERLFMDALL